jgi:fatty acid desaturase
MPSGGDECGAMQPELDSELREQLSGMSDAEFRSFVRRRGLLEPQPAYYAGLILRTLLLLGLSLACLFLLEDLRWQLVNAVFLALVFGQIGVIGHDADHAQVSRSRPLNDGIGVAVTFLTGLERSWWRQKHQAHHRAPNRTGWDPDIEISVLACTEAQALEKKWYLWPIVAFQAFWFFPLCCLQGLNWQLTGLHFVLREKLGYPRAERLAMLGHLAVYYGLIFSVLAPLDALAFIGVHQACFGLYMGLMFATNHMGMPILDEDAGLGFVEQQVVASRSIRPRPVLDFLLCGLNRQIEHHVFPKMSRNRLPEVRRYLRALCAARGIPYHDVGWFTAQAEVLSELHRVSAPLRRLGPRRRSTASVSR